jgi:hypothetical protein
MQVVALRSEQMGGTSLVTRNGGVNHSNPPVSGLPGSTGHVNWHNTCWVLSGEILVRIGGPQDCVLTAAM